MGRYDNVNVTYYVIQHRRTHESPWLKPKGRLKPVDDRWTFSSWDYFGRAFCPRIGKGNDRRPRSKKADEDQTAVYQECSRHGWKQLKYALHALQRARKMDDGGEFDCIDPYGHKCQAVRHKFRVVKVHYVNQVSELEGGKYNG